MRAVEEWMEGGERRDEETRANKVTGSLEGAGHQEGRTSRQRLVKAPRRGVTARGGDWERPKAAHLHLISLLKTRGTFLQLTPGIH